MAYLHCHSCGWSQDDFWTFFKVYRWRKSWWKRFSFGYNPITKFIDDVKWLWKPKWIRMDKWLVDDLKVYTGVSVKTRVRNSKFQVFSWSLLKLELVKEWKIFRNQKWWTYKSWLRNKDIAMCPKCGKRNFDID